MTFDDDGSRWTVLAAPPPRSFDCGAEMQNRFLHVEALQAAHRGTAVTHLLHLGGTLAGYVALCADALPLAHGERPHGVTREFVPAVKMAQLAVDRRFQGGGLGERLVDHAAAVARRVRTQVAVRHLTVDARTLALLRWYERLGFLRNERAQEVRRQEAVRRGRDPAAIAISLRFDLRDGGT